MSANLPGQSEPEYLGAGPAGDHDGSDRFGSFAWPGRSRRVRALSTAALAVVAAVGAGAYGVVQVMAGGSSPASAVPADAVGYVSLDLDPSAAQKIEAVGALNKFPALRDELRIGNRDDVRRAVFDMLISDNECNLHYDRDVEPWIGDRVALAAVPDIAEGGLPLVVLQVSDRSDARAGVRKLETCSIEPDESVPHHGVAFVDDYMLLAETQKQADEMAADAGAAALADDGAFTAAMDRVGDPGIITMYVSADAPGAVTRAQQADRPQGDLLTDFEAQADVRRGEQLQVWLKGFQGAAGVVRFADGAVEAEFAAKGLPGKVGLADGAAPDLGTLPASTAAAVSLTFRDGWAHDFVATVSGVLGDGQDAHDVLADAERTTGLELPEDLENLLGDGLTVSVDAGADLQRLSESPDPTKVPAGIRIQGDPERITAVIDKLKAAAGAQADIVEVVTGDGMVAVGADPEYVGLLIDEGTLGDVDAFAAAVPDSEQASGAFFVNFDAGDGWAERLAGLLSDGDPDVTRNIAPLDAFCAIGWQDDAGVQHGLLRLTTD